MATITERKDSEEGELHLELKGTRRGKDFDFILRRNYIRVEPKDQDWRILEQSEKLQIFNAILRKYRERSMGDGDMKIAALGVTEDGDIYIATNTERLSSPYFRQCAELNMVTSLTQNDVYDQLKKDPTKITPHEPKLTELYMLGGKDAKPDAPNICPCGNCTDMLTRVMSSPDAPIYVLPMSPTDDTLTIAHAENVSSPELIGKVWKTNIEQLNAKRVINLAPQAAETQKAGFRQLLLRSGKLPEERAKELTDAMIKNIQDDTEAPKVHNMGDLVKLLLNPLTIGMAIKALPSSIVAETEQALRHMLKTAENALTQRQSVAALDLTARGDSGVDMSELNHFMVGEIQRTFGDRLRGFGLKDASKDDIREAVENKIYTIRCVVVRLDDGTFRTSVESQSDIDNAYPCGEVSTIMEAANKLGTQGVREVWAMEMNPKDIAKGIMHTSSKEGAERIIKRRTRSTDQVQFHFIPFNSGEIADDRRIEKITTHASARELFPSYYLGNNIQDRAVAFGKAW